MHSAGVATALLESGMVEMPKEGGQITFGLEAPAGLIQITAECSADGKAENITLRNAASFVEALDLSIDVPEIGSVKLDIAYGGMWYAVVEARPLGLALRPENGKEICRVGEMIKTACREQYPVAHPIHTSYIGVDIIVLREPEHGSDEDAVYGKNAVVMSKVFLSAHCYLKHASSWHMDESNLHLALVRSQ
jgi:proline racemase